MNSATGLTRDQYRTLLVENGFKFEKTQTAYPSKLGEEDVYTHSKYKNQFYITRCEVNGQYGFNPQRKIAKQFDKIVLHNTTGDKDYSFWVGDSFIQLMEAL